MTLSGRALVGTAMAAAWILTFLGVWIYVTATDDGGIEPASIPPIIGLSVVAVLTIYAVRNRHAWYAILLGAAVFVVSTHLVDTDMSIYSSALDTVVSELLLVSPLVIGAWLLRPSSVEE